MMAEDKELKKLVAERIGAEQLSKFKQEYAPRQLNAISVEDKIGLLKPITSAEVAQYTMLASAVDDGLDVACKYLLNSLWLGGDTCLIDDDEYFITAMLQLQNMIELKKSAFTRL